ncbi:hypothetical protein KGM_201863 [Danaus plexippus plexippus]|uniref:Uncharacterized protein n=1 Tax=Danaus plexippus plexippus TaxID=278856 RepID=A0A212EWK5_DANPL|nr:hypothetical protein KGM_201863 [Danaus plexippus plexippus]
MLLKCTADGRRIKVNGPPMSQANVARGMYIFLSYSPETTKINNIKYVVAFFFVN